MDQYFGRARSALGPDAAEAEWERGARIAFEEAITIALSANASPHSADQALGPPLRE